MPREGRHVLGLARRGSEEILDGHGSNRASWSAGTARTFPRTNGDAKCLFAFCLVLVACDAASPVAPPGTTLTITAMPSQVAPQSVAIVRVLARRGTGAPVAPGTEVRFATTGGSISSSAVTDEMGVATATFRADNRIGAVTITASVGGSPIQGSLQILVGSDAGSRQSIFLSANPTSVETGGSSAITMVVRNADGSPALPGGEALFTTTRGTLSSRTAQLDQLGTAAIRLTAGSVAGTAEVVAFFGESAPARIVIEVRPR